MRNLSSKVVLCAALVMLGAAPARAFDLQSGIGFVAITNSVEDTEYVLRDAQNQEVGRGLADRFGSLVFRDLVQGASYTVAETGGGTQPVTVRVFEDHPDQSFYDAQPALVEGLNYIQMRDGTLLAAMVRPPLGESFSSGRRFPTVIEYSGYAAADPNTPQASTLLAQVLGYATVGVNMRGSGCSGGIIDLFDLPTTADGYDIVETVATQSWSFPTVGMIGISFPGISQLFVAGAQPPHLAAIAPFSVIGDIYRSPGFPGGIFNNGFAETWLQERADDAEPAPEGGQAWAIQRVNNGDTVCEDNQKLRLQTLDPVDFTASEPYYTPPLMDNRSPINWVSDIRVPMFLSGAWQDEQTGSGFVTLLRHLPKGRTTKVLLTNGVHSSPLEPEGLWTWIAFLDIYVAGRKPDPDRLAPFAQAIYSQIWGPGQPTPPLPPDRYVQYNLPADARAAFEREPRIRVLMENGAGSPDPGIPAPTFDLTFQKWPPPGMRPTAWYFGPGGTLSKDRPDSEGFDSYNPDPDLRPMQTIPGQGQSESWEIMPAYDWQPLPDGAAVAYATAPLTEDVTIVGQGAVDVFLRSSAVDTDIQVTLSEIRPDGLETYVQSGWLRASHRKLAKKQSKTEVVQTHLEADVEPMPAGQFVKMRIGIFASAHVFRAGSRIRISLEAPGGDRTRWAFDTFDTNGLVTNDVARSRFMASRLVLPVIRRAEPPPGLPPCPGLRGQPCRTYEPAANGG
jgi:predicted acyl esterase